MNKGVLVLLIIIGIGIFSVSTITKGHNWGDDFAMYIMHARNITEGKPYSDTGLILHEYSGTYSPQNYPPGFPILLVPVYAISGLDFYAMKLYMVFWMLLFLWLIWVYFKNKLPELWIVFIILIIGLSPFFRDMKEHIVSDLPAVCFILLAFYINELRRTNEDKKLYLYSLAFIIWFGAAIRITGILILPAILIYDYILLRNFKKLEWKILIIVTGLMIIQAVIFPGSNYLDILLFGITDNNFGAITDEIFDRANNYLHSFSSITHLSYITPLNNNLNEWVFWIFHITAAAGFYIRIRRKLSPVELFVIFYMLVIFIFPGYQGTRYLIPVIPFYFFYSMYAISSIQLKWVSVSVSSIIIICLIFIYNDDHNAMPVYEVAEGVQSEAAQDIFQFIHFSTPANAVLMCAKPRAFSLFTERKGVVYPDDKFKDKFYELIKQNKVNYIISGKYDYSEYKIELINNTQGKFENVLINDMFSIYFVKE